MVSEQDGIRLGMELLQKQIAQVPDNLRGQLSDGYHTFDELYEHRIINYIALCTSMIREGYETVWKTRVHSDGIIWDGWFLLGIFKEKGKQITYHIPYSKWGNECKYIPEIEKAPEYDGHTSADVLERLKSL